MFRGDGKRSERRRVIFDCISHHQVTVLVPLITLKAAEPVVGIRNVISILFQQQYGIIKGWGEGSRLKSV
jgi:hypothetical protein